MVLAASTSVSSPPLHSCTYPRRRFRRRNAVAAVAASASVERSEEDIVIVGGGIAGLATALSLRRLGVSSTVLEQGASLRAGGTSLTLFKNGWRVLDAIGVADELRGGAPVSSYARPRRPPPAMPSPLKDRPSGRLGHLLAALRPARAGALPVQTGFPTSLADLVVKNHGRLKKPSSSASASSKRKKRGVSPPPSPSPTLSPPPSSSPPPPAAAVSPSAHPRPDLSPVEAVRHTKGGVFGLGLGFLALGGVVSLALLVIWSKKVVAAVTVASFSLFLLESVRSSSLPRRTRPRPAATKKLDLDVRGYVSPIREVEAEAEPPRPSCSDSDRGSEVSILDIEERSEAGDDSSNPKAKTKKRSWKKLIAIKLHKGRECKEADSSGSFRSESNQADAMVGGNAKATDSSDSRRGKRKQADAEADALAKSSDSSGSRHGKGNEMDAEVDNNARPIEIDASPDLTEADEGGGSRFPVVVVAAVVLVGLVAGKLPAVVFTVLCSAFLSSVQRLPCDGGDVQGW